MSPDSMASTAEFPCASAPLLIPGPAGELEVRTACPSPEIAVAATAVVCHPHPLHGGSMQNKVVHTLARAFGDLGMATLRFNFRGVGRSSGVFDHANGETDDLLAAIQWVRARRPQDQIWLAGFSFGSYVALRASVRTEVRQLVLVAPPVNLYDFDALSLPKCPLLVIQGSADEVVPAEQVQRWVNGLGAAAQFIYMDGVSHFFHQRLNDLRSALTQSLTSQLPS